MFEPYIQGGPGAETTTTTGAPLTREQFREYLRGSVERVAKIPSRRDETIVPLVNELKQIGGDGGPIDRIVEPVPEFDAHATAYGCTPTHSTEGQYATYGCGPGEALPPDTVTEGARLPRKTREELIAEYWDMIQDVWNLQDIQDWTVRNLAHQRLADLAGQIAGMEK